jgi:hypothetical protein
MKHFLILIVAVVLAGCSDSSDGFVQEALPGTNESTTPGVPDPVISEPINSRFVGNIKASASGAGQSATYDFDSFFEYREKAGGKLIGYSRMNDKLQEGKLIVDYWSEGQRTNANVVLYLNFNPACSNLKLAGKLDAQGSIIFPKTTQKLGCGLFVSLSVTTDAAVLTQGKTEWDFWPYIENHFATR